MSSSLASLIFHINDTENENFSSVILLRIGSLLNDRSFALFKRGLIVTKY